jgi:adenosine deaminase
MAVATAEHLRRLPKVEIHCHTEGSARAGTVSDLARKNGVALPVADPADLFKFANLNQFLDIYTVMCQCFVDVDDFRRLAYEALEDAAAAGVRYREMFFSPGFAMNLGVPIETIWEGIKAGVRDARHDLGIQARMILDFDKPSGPDHAIAMAEFAGAEPDRDLLIGMGADSVEAGIDHAAFAPAYEVARNRGLRRTMHAGEDGPAENIRIALDECGCERIDHGFRLMDDAALTARVADLRIPITTCPTSNVVIANVIPDVGKHPISAMREAGVLATINSDDPGMMQFDLADEYVVIADAFEFSLGEMEQFSLDGIESSWASDDERRSLRARFEGDFDTLRDEYGLPSRG